MISTILVGFIVGLLARALHPGDDNIGWIWTILLGIAGSFVATFVGSAVGWYQPGEAAGWIASVIFAIVVLWVYYKIRGIKMGKKV
ncbi:MULTISPECIES: GlsB/YeaQ/YmgE family stress response membrane protein [Vitreoscilla]|uniref:GlsB/YeaQ/YmgE family stress response membrane protein n=1 Tax=Vitreoscilla stercoraria TaxID=61 RepID=A0ABY4ECD5_VITST|nr:MULTISPECIES: GlsB/YeaQ/YmgE family stress response membrane protein [Vitreoscilla]AUZ05573.1 hypothetical protein ADP71_21440 [Vitreoscilla sp. C1]UOO93013.1 GlsB/YeaQ/YmgE family stress response membrane protein [Vitreoscilla stercoraria]